MVKTIENKDEPNIHLHDEINRMDDAKQHLLVARRTGTFESKNKLPIYLDHELKMHARSNRSEFPPLADQPMFERNLPTLPDSLKTLTPTKYMKPGS
jgi:hypothetical protein